MAAAVLSRSRGVAGGLYFLFTLLCLVCIASSQIHDDRLKNLREVVQKIEQKLENLKAEKATFLEDSRESIRSLEAMMALQMLKISEQSSEDFLPLNELLESAKRSLESTKDLLEKTKTYVDEQDELLDAKIADIELNLGRNKTIVRALEEHQAEL